LVLAKIYKKPKVDFQIDFRLTKIYSLELE